MKKLILTLFIALGSAGFAQQQNQITRTHYHYTIVNIENEHALQQVVDEISAYKGISGCKYYIKSAKKMAELSFLFDEQAQKGEGDKSNPLPNTKKLLLDKGLDYAGFTFEIEKITN